jgi:DNA-binding PadR family transcriptional regulator
MKELTKTEEIILLSIMTLKDEAYGFKIRLHVSKLLGKDFTYGNLYSVLNQLVKKKYVDKRPGEPTEQRQGKIRMYYSLSQEGVKALNESYSLNQKLWALFSPDTRFQK